MPYEIATQYDGFMKVEMRDIDGKKRTVTTNLHIIYQLMNRMRKGYSPIIVICGSQRIGKSFVGIWLSYILSLMTGKPFDPTKTTFYEPLKAIKELEFRSKEALLIDEAGDVLDVREWYKQTHQALKSIINTQAYKTMMYIFISPFTIDIDKAFRKHFDFQLRVDDRGRVKSFRFIKKYDELNEKRAVRRRFLDDIDIRMSMVPDYIWNKYLNYSIKEKEKIRKVRSEPNTAKEEQPGLDQTNIKKLLQKVGVPYGN